MIKKSLAFTLGEILIALTVIGVVAVLVMPQIVLGQKAAKAKSQFDTAYSLMARAIADMDSDEISINPNDYKAAKPFVNEFKKYNKITIDNYTLSNNVHYKTRAKGTPVAANMAFFDDGKFVLNNGMIVMIENPQNNFNGLLVSVDINGEKQPNKWGYDLFTFEVIGDDLYPVGAPGTGQATSAKTRWGASRASVKKYCDDKEQSNINGITCAYFAASDEEYFKKVYNGH